MDQWRQRTCSTCFVCKITTHMMSPTAVSGLGKTGSSSSGGKDSSSRGSAGSSSSSMDESDASSHHHNYHRHHRHSPFTASGKSQPHSSSSNYPSTSTYNTYPDYSSPLSFSNPDTEYGGLALATGHGGGHHGGGHGGGHAHGHGDAYGHGHTTYYKTVNKIDQSSLGLLGLLGLLSLLSNVLLLLTTTARTTTAAAGGGMRRTEDVLQFRKKRDTIMLLKMADEDEHELSRRSVVGHLSHLILPSLNVIGHAKDGRIPLNCTYQEICKTNKVLVQVFGVDEGRPVASVMSTAITRLLANNDRIKSFNKRDNIMQKSIGAPLVFIEKLLAEAGLAGRNGKDCEIAYPTCAALSTQEEDDGLSLKDGIKRREPLQVPLLITPERASAIILGQQS
ncbi:unnamed protein product [Orchesella dallaii]|uniref:Uncharacterized protein n=1 Tax=Orchesella dallaii TaxID=48710 RepID=A0ABP1QUC5_9HEXA